MVTIHFANLAQYLLKIIQYMCTFIDKLIYNIAI